MIILVDMNGNVMNPEVLESPENPIPIKTDEIQIHGIAHPLIENDDLRINLNDPIFLKAVAEYRKREDFREGKSKVRMSILEAMLGTNYQKGDKK